jgi:hypothetical protein
MVARPLVKLARALQTSVRGRIVVVSVVALSRDSRVHPALSRHSHQWLAMDPYRLLYSLSVKLCTMILVAFSMLSMLFTPDMLQLE